MANDSYQQPSRRQFLTTSGLALAGALMPAPFQVLAQQTDPKYSVKFQLLNHSDIELQRQLNVPPWHFDPRGVPYTATAEAMREIFQTWQDRGLIPDLSRLDTTLEEIANQLKSDQDLLHRTFDNRELQLIQSGVDTLYRMVYERTLPEVSHPLRIEFAGVLKEGPSLEPILLTGYSVKHVGQQATYERKGDLTSEVWDFTPHGSGDGYRGFKIVPKNDENEYTAPLNEFTIPRVDVTTIRRELLEGLRNQNLRYRSGLRPIVPK